MWRLIMGGFLVLHGVLHAAIWIPPQRGSEIPHFGPQVSWLFAGNRPLVITLAVTSAAGYTVSGVAYLAHWELWAVAAVFATGASMALIVATFTPWWTFAILINAVVTYAAVRALAIS